MNLSAIKNSTPVFEISAQDLISRDVKERLRDGELSRQLSAVNIDER
ncbi:hypothetical protein N9M01_00185 [Luminiphilus sp.]|nr:hypothetical protein [Luminiphilus sp.]